MTSAALRHLAARVAELSVSAGYAGYSGYAAPEVAETLSPSRGEAVTKAKTGAVTAVTAISPCNRRNQTHPGVGYTVPAEKMADFCGSPDIVTAVTAVTGRDDTSHAALAADHAVSGQQLMDPAPDTEATERRAAELLAEAERNPAYRITDRAKALAYFRARAMASAMREPSISAPISGMSGRCLRCAARSTQRREYRAASC
jgi:hypothetical protein